MAGDWFKVHRKLREHPIMQHDGLARLWLYCLIRANWKPTTWLVPGTTQAIEIPRGAFITGRESLHQDLYGSGYRGEYKPSSRTVWRWVESLQGLGCVSVRVVSNRCTLLTICNYDSYQSSEDEPCPAGVQQVSSTCPADVPHMSTEEEVKKERRKEGKKKTSPLPPEGWLPPEQLNTERFCQMWHKWEEYRRQIRKPLTDATRESQLVSLAKIGEEAACEMIAHTIESSWQGLRRTDGKPLSEVAKLAGSSRVVSDDELLLWNPTDGGQGGAA